jgi:hypothetical protein
MLAATVRCTRARRNLSIREPKVNPALAGEEEGIPRSLGGARHESGVGREVTFDLQCLRLAG